MDKYFYIRFNGKLPLYLKEISRAHSQDLRCCSSNYAGNDVSSNAVYMATYKVKSEAPVSLFSPFLWKIKQYKEKLRSNCVADRLVVVQVKLASDFIDPKCFPMAFHAGEHVIISLVQKQERPNNDDYSYHLMDAWFIPNESIQWFLHVPGATNHNFKLFVKPIFQWTKRITEMMEENKKGPCQTEDTQIYKWDRIFCFWQINREIEHSNLLY